MAVLDIPVGHAIDTSLASGLVTRLCHDLSGPLLAVLSALDMAVEGAVPANPDDPLAVAAESARHLSARLSLLRAAWGVDPGPLDAIRIMELAMGLPNRARFTVDLAGMGSAAIGGDVGQILLNMLLLATTALPKGGTLTLQRTGAAVVLRVEGPQAAWNEDLAGILAAPDATSPTPFNALPVLLGLLATHAGARIDVTPPVTSAGVVSATLRLSRPV